MNLKHHAFVTEYLYWGDQVIAYQNAYKKHGSSYRSLQSAANRLLAMPEVAEAIDKAQSAIRSRVEEEVAARLKQELLTIQKKREILAQVATGSLYIEQMTVGKNCSNCTHLVKPNINQMLKAIDLDNKLAGHYAAKLATAGIQPVSTAAQQEPENKNRENLQQNATIRPAAQPSPVQEDDVWSPEIHVTPAGNVISHAGLRRLLQGSAAPSPGNGRSGS